MPPTSSSTPECSNSAFSVTASASWPASMRRDDGLEDAAVDRIGEMLRREEFGDPLIGLVVGQQRAEQRLLRLQVGWRQTLRQTEQGRIDGVHGRCAA